MLTCFPSTVFAQDYEPRLSAPYGEPYYTSELNAYSQTGYGMPNCVAYAYGRVYELNGEAPEINRGNAGEWWFINKYNGYYESGNEHRLGAVACWSNHVAVVESINDDGSLTLSESHWGGNYFNTVTYYDMYSHYGQTFYGYIYTYEPEDTEITEETAKEEEIPDEQRSYKMEDESTQPQELDCFTALEFAIDGGVLPEIGKKNLIVNI